MHKKIPDLGVRETFPTTGAEEGTIGTVATSMGRTEDKTSPIAFTVLILQESDIPVVKGPIVVCKA